MVSNEASIDGLPLAEKPDSENEEPEVNEESEVAAVKCEKTKEVRERSPKKKITQHHVLEEQYKALLLKQNNLKLESKKLELEIALLELKVKRETENDNTVTTINFSPVLAGRPFLS